MGADILPEKAGAARATNSKCGKSLSYNVLDLYDLSKINKEIIVRRAGTVANIPMLKMAHNQLDLSKK